MNNEAQIWMASAVYWRRRCMGEFDAMIALWRDFRKEIKKW